MNSYDTYGEDYHVRPKAPESELWRRANPGTPIRWPDDDEEFPQRGLGNQQ